MFTISNKVRKLQIYLLQLRKQIIVSEISNKVAHGKSNCMGILLVTYLILFVQVVYCYKYVIPAVQLSNTTFYMHAAYACFPTLTISIIKSFVAITYQFCTIVLVEDAKHVHNYYSNGTC